MKKLITVLLTLSLLLSCLLPVTAAESGFPPKTDSGELTLGNTEVAQEEKLSAEEILQGAFAEEQSAARSLLEPTSTPVSQQIETTGYAADELVTFIVVLDTLPLLEAGFSAEEISKATKAVSDYGLTQTKAIQSAKTGLTAAFGREKGFRLGYSYTVATTGLSVTTQYGNKAAIEAMDGVKKVYVAPTFSLPETVESLQPATGNSSTMIGADSLNSSGYTGLGMKIAILDTGLVLGHPSFQALPEDKLTESSMTREFVEEVWSELNASQTTLLCNAYHSSKVPFVFNYTTMTFDVSHATAGSDHGTHVAGTAAANQTADTTVVGVAPDAQVIVMQVFSSTGAAWDTIMAALEDCVRLDVDAANLSLGAAAGFSSADEEFDRVLGLFMQTDIEVLIASGNDTNNAYQNAFGLNMSLSGNPDIGLTGTPATYEGALSVASANNDGAKLLYFTAEGREIGFNDTATTSFTRFISNFQGQTLSFVAVPGLGEAADYEGLDVTGKVALVSRGTISFPEKQANAQAAGAIAVVIYDNVQGSMINMQINDGEGNIPAVFISKADGDYLAALGKGSFTVCEGDLKTFKQTQTLSDFSSWGVTPDLKLKPEITGVGGSIYSSTDPSISGSWYNYMSGTSMATPQIAGAMAVLLEYLKENYGYEEAELRRVAANLLMSTANPVMQGDSEYSPRWQGAGLADLLRATQSGAYLSDSDTSEGTPQGGIR